MISLNHHPWGYMGYGILKRPINKCIKIKKIKNEQSNPNAIIAWPLPHMLVK
jgi:hypothetical protein